MLPDLTSTSAGTANHVRLAGRLLERGSLRHTPAGIPVIEFRLGHFSEQAEAGVSRRVECEMGCVALGSPALLLTGRKPGDGLCVTGFLAARSVKSRTPVLHVNEIEFLEGNKNGIQT
ncbi:MAG: primosomal replication protein N [Candidatus Nitricoxidivorans perseverans]|uniref:Replication restart protein PriB n=1 Tax=Candidatus Nitricoxidivorans perseverans TaxID=2975601 RepID=A0AA49FM27_9PROT|nr:MAG: primosomal replication protein N [Candidatus Nitricoxidivorans perseverans]